MTVDWVYPRNGNDGWQDISRNKIIKMMDG